MNQISEAYDVLTKLSYQAFCNGEAAPSEKDLSILKAALARQADWPARFAEFVELSVQDLEYRIENPDDFDASLVGAVYDGTHFTGLVLPELEEVESFSVVDVHGEEWSMDGDEWGIVGSCGAKARRDVKEFILSQ